jgi:hypothetical protein
MDFNWAIFLSVLAAIIAARLVEAIFWMLVGRFGN